MEKKIEQIARPRVLQLRRPPLEHTHTRTHTHTFIHTLVSSVGFFSGRIGSSENPAAFAGGVAELARRAHQVRRHRQVALRRLAGVGVADAEAQRLVGRVGVAVFPPLDLVGGRRDVGRFRRRRRRRRGGGGVADAVARRRLLRRVLPPLDVDVGRRFRRRDGGGG